MYFFRGAIIIQHAKLSFFKYFTSKLHIFLHISESSKIFENYLNKIKMQRLEHFNILIVGQLNISPIRNKFEMVAETITNFDIFNLGIKNRFNFLLYAV